MIIETFLGISIKHDDGTIQRFAFTSDECTVTEDLSEAIVRKEGKCIGNTSNSQWDYGVYLYQNEYYVSAGMVAPDILSNPPIMTRLLPIFSVDDELSTIVNALNDHHYCACKYGCSRCKPIADFMAKHKHLIKD